MTEASGPRPDPDVPLLDLKPDVGDFMNAAITGLSGTPKSLPYRFLYDAEGSALFDRITALPEYYPTRTERRILTDRAGEIARILGPDVQLVEPGSGSSEKVRILLDALERPFGYVAIDISCRHLMAAARKVQADYPRLRVEAICADFNQTLTLPPKGPGPRVGFYPGSTIGNLSPLEAGRWLNDWRERLGPGSLLLIGVDLRKDARVLEAAYDDSEGVTAAFTLNLLQRANRDLGANFDLGAFRHEADYLADEGRVRIQLRSMTDQTVSIAGHTVRFAAGETIHVEDSWKYTIEGFKVLARGSGYRSIEVWTDPDDLFSVHLMQAAA